MKNVELISDSGNSSISDSSSAVSKPSINEKNSEDIKNINANEIEFKMDEKKIQEESELASQSFSYSSSNTLSPLTRNSTLTRSQRKKVHPQLNIKNLIMANDTYSPPVLDSSMISPIQIADRSQMGHSNCDQKIDQNENFIISSLQKQNEITIQSEMNDSSNTENIDHPLSSSFSIHNNTINENTFINPNGQRGIQQSFNSFINSL